MQQYVPQVVIKYANIVEVQKNTGHRNLKTLQKYAGVVDQYYREAMEKNAL